MLRPDPTRLQAQQNGTSADGYIDDGGSPSAVPAVGDIDIQQELNKLEELVLSSPRVPFTGRTLLDEDQLLDQLDAIRLNLPPAFRQAVQILQQRQTLMAEAERYAEDLILAAEQQAAQILDEMGIVRQAEQMAQHLKAQAQADCDTLRAQVIAEIETLQTQAQREWETLRHNALAEQAMIQQESDAYADQVLSQVEQQLSQMLRIIQNGRTHLQPGPEDVPPNAVGRGTKPGKLSTSKPSQPAPRPERSRSQNPGSAS